jgi:hypothetical protein
VTEAWKLRVREGDVELVADDGTRQGHEEVGIARVLFHATDEVREQAIWLPRLDTIRESTIRRRLQRFGDMSLTPQKLLA